MSLADITLRVPAHRVSCAAWLHAQEPSAVADALSLCEAAFTAVRENVTEEESAKIQAVHRLRIQELQDILQREKVVHAEELRIIREKVESTNEVLLRRHGDALETLRAQTGGELEEQQARGRQYADNLLATISSLVQSLNNEKATKQTAIDEAVARELSRLQGEHARQETHHQRQIESLRLGEYRDEHKQSEKGCADGLWVWQPSASVPLLSCIVEVKESKVLHSLGMGKFQRDLRAATQSNHARVPVCYASRATMIEMAFRAMTEAWPLISRQRGEGVQLTVQSAAEQFEEQLSHCDALSKHISKISEITKSAKYAQLIFVIVVMQMMVNQMSLRAKSLEKVRDNMVKGIEGVRVNRPSLVPEIPEGSLASSEGITEVLDP